MKTILIITDGIGHKPHSKYNAFTNANTPTYEELFKTSRHTLITTYGTKIGLPHNQMGNSEVGHLTIGAGRVLKQDLVLINEALDNGEVEREKSFLDFIARDRLHILMLLSDGGVHSCMHITMKFLKLIKKLVPQKSIKLHLITDGRDVAPKSAIKYLEELFSFLEPFSGIEIASICGRFYAMDRDRRWERIQSAYDNLLSPQKPYGIGDVKNIKNYILENYNSGITDEFIKPISFGDFSGIEDNAGVFFMNFRPDRAKELSKALGDSSFRHFSRGKIAQNLYLLGLKTYDENFKFMNFLFHKIRLDDTLAHIISDANLTQAHIAETEKYAHITFFINGGTTEILKGEKQILIPSKKIATYDKAPQMSAYEIKDAVLNCIDEGIDFIVVNFANGDMVGHTGELEASIKAVEVVDHCLGEIIEKAKTSDYALIITSDHGNCEEMADSEGRPLTNHTVGDVWCFIIAPNIGELKSDKALDAIAPTALKLLGLKPPSVMSEPLF